MAECKACGHRDTQHAMFGCNQGFCKCELSNQDIIDFEKLAALREAGEKMAQASHVFKSVATFRETDGNCYHCGADETQTHSQKCHFDILQKELAAALKAWEAAKK